jgi:PAS domain S-box-containing protein
MNIAEVLFKVKDIMNMDFIKVCIRATIKDISDRMVEENRGEVIIVDDDDKIAGIFTSYDLSIMMKENDLSLEECIYKHAKKKVITIDPEATARTARNVMINNNVGRLPVVENGKILGIVTSDNLRDTFYLKINELFDLQAEVMNHVHEAICITDRKGIVIFWNKSSEKLYNIMADSIVGRPIDEFFPNAMTLKVLSNGVEIQSVQHEPVKGKLVILSVVPIYDQDGNIVAAVSTDRDITEVVTLSKELETEKKKVEILEDAYRKEIAANYCFDAIVGKSKKIIDAIALVQKVAPSSASVLITGESGTGKEVFAKSIHEASGRTGDFVAINCSAIPHSLLESELFGYVEGAFTGAVRKGKIGRFELANNGTIFLDEIGDMPIDMQAKLLRVLQDGVIFRLGSEKPINTNVRIVAATNRDLKQFIRENKFRDDLYYRLAVVQMELPPLRERKEDIKDLVNQFIVQISNNEGIKIRRIEQNIYSILSNYNWEGNIRELRNVIQRVVVLSNNGEITVENIPEYIVNNSIVTKAQDISILDLEQRITQVEVETIREAMKQSGGNKQRAAQLLNIKRSTLYYKLKQYELE